MTDPQQRPCRDCGAPVIGVTYPSGRRALVNAGQVVIAQLMEGRPPKIEETHVGHTLHQCAKPRAQRIENAEGNADV